MKSAVGGYDVVHLAVHGKFDAAEPLLSYLELGGGGGDDGRLTAAEMFGLPLAKSRVVVLSACETGRAEATHGNELLGMERALIYAGAPALLLSQWQVDSEATARWMEAFLRSRRGRSPCPKRRALPSRQSGHCRSISIRTTGRRSRWWDGEPRMTQLVEDVAAWFKGLAGGWSHTPSSGASFSTSSATWSFAFT